MVTTSSQVLSEKKSISRSDPNVKIVHCDCQKVVRQVVTRPFCADKDAAITLRACSLEHTLRSLVFFKVLKI